MESQIKGPEDNIINATNINNNNGNNINNSFNVDNCQNNETNNDNCINSQNSSLKKHKFNVDEIIEKCKNKNDNELLNYMCAIMHEKKKFILESLYKELGKDFLISILEKTLEIENNGGLIKGKSKYAKKKEEKKSNENNESIKNVNQRKTTGGIFFTLIKTNPEAKVIINRASKQDSKEAKQRKKVCKLMDKLNI